jgi:DNA-binding phage protein
MEQTATTTNWQRLILELKSKAKYSEITHKKIAEETEMTRANVSRFFGAKNPPTMETFEKVANAVGMELTLFGKSNPIL